MVARGQEDRWDSMKTLWPTRFVKWCDGKAKRSSMGTPLQPGRAFTAAGE